MIRKFTEILTVVVLFVMFAQTASARVVRLPAPEAGITLEARVTVLRSFGYGAFVQVTNIAIDEGVENTLSAENQALLAELRRRAKEIYVAAGSDAARSLEKLPKLVDPRTGKPGPTVRAQVKLQVAPHTGFTDGIGFFLREMGEVEVTPAPEPRPRNAVREM